MALTLQQRADVRRALGWSAQYAQTDSQLENAFDGLDAQPEHETQVLELLADIVTVRASLVASRARLKIRKAGSVELDTTREIGVLRLEGSRLTGSLASIMGVERRHNEFGSSSPRRVSFYGPAERSFF